ncbi:hypothetical protein [Azorhizobium sp. AG788]|uniref:hypothetical protein n=1 Tax=Azorhizobium sp. AG788 TaxID=2183897 RepID=UPI003139A8D8
MDERICWTRMQAEAGEQLGRIVHRKELERRSGGGLFFWGVGTAPSRAIPGLVRTAAQIDVVFSVMKSRPKAQDVAPSRILAWRGYTGEDGQPRPIPDNVLVTSRAGSRNCHYALVCRSEVPLEVADQGSFDPSAYRNIGAGGAVGASQVTALLERCGRENSSSYRVAMRARLTDGYWVKLIDPVELIEPARAALEEEMQAEADWLDVVSYVRNRCGRAFAMSGTRSGRS